MNPNIVELMNSDYKRGSPNGFTEIQDLEITIHNLNIIIQEFNITITRLRASRDLYRINYKDLTTKN